MKFILTNVHHSDAKRVNPKLPPDDATADLVAARDFPLPQTGTDGNTSDVRYSTKFTIPLNKWVSQVH